MNDKKMKSSEIIAYGIGSLGEGLSYNLFYGFFIYFLTNVAKIEAGIAGTIVLFSVFWGIFTDLWAGRKSDNSESDKGRRIPFIIKGAIPLGLFVFLMFVDINVNMFVKVGFYTVLNMMFWLFLSIVTIPYISLGSELTGDYSDRSKLRTSATFFLNGSGIIVASGVFYTVSRLKIFLGNESLAWSVVSLAIGAIVSTSFLLTGLIFSKRGNFVKTQKNRLKDNFVKNVRNLLELSQYRIVLLIALIVNILIGIMASMGVYLLTYSYGFNEKIYSIVMLISTIWFVFAVIPYGNLINKFGKKTSLITGLMFCIVASILRIFMPISFSNALITTLLYNTGIAGFWTIIYAMIYDVIALANLKTKLRQEGLIISINSLVMKLGGSVGMWIMGIYFSVLKLDFQDPLKTDYSGRQVYLFAIWATIALVLISICFAMKYRINEKNYNKIVHAINSQIDPANIEDDDLKQLLK